MKMQKKMTLLEAFYSALRNNIHVINEVTKSLFIIAHNNRQR